MKISVSGIRQQCGRKASKLPALCVRWSNHAGCREHARNGATRRTWRGRGRWVSKVRAEEHYDASAHMYLAEVE
jgi:hypothetical protein